MLVLFFFFLLIRRPQISTLFPYTTLFRSFGTQFVYRILGLVPENVAVAIVEINQVSRRDAMANKWHLVVPDVDYGYGKDRKSTRLNSSHVSISYAVFCLKKKKKEQQMI